MTGYEIRLEIWKEAYAYHLQKFIYKKNSHEKGILKTEPTCPIKEEVIETAYMLKRFADQKQ